MVIFLYNQYIFVWVQHFWGSPLNQLSYMGNSFSVSHYIMHISACIKGSLGVRDSQKLPWDFQKSMPGSLGLPTFKDI